jgi:SAM-dependent methyltransferase
MTFQESLLLAVSRSTADHDYYSTGDEPTIDDALSLLEREYADFGALVANKRVVDFGCGGGYQSIALVKRYGCRVLAIDSNSATLANASARAQSLGVPTSKLAFATGASAAISQMFDVVISQNSFEHFPDPSAVLGQMQSLLAASGKLLITFGPPWLAPYGSHMRFFCRMPWINVVFSEPTVMTVRSRFRGDGARRYEDVESGLNKMTLAKFERIISSSPLRLDFRRDRCIKGFDILASIPIIREFCVNHVSVILSAET